MISSVRKYVHQALVVMSPASDGDEVKNQDRAVWYASQNVACVCDGVTQSPFSERAAELACQWAPSLFRGDMDQRLGAISDLLVAQRLELQGQRRKAPVSLLEQVTHERLAQAFQSTLTAICLTSINDQVSVEIAQCGDSAVFAFSPEGELVFDTFNKCTSAIGTSNGFSFDPGDEVLVKTVCVATDRMDLASAAGIEAKHAPSWMLCAPLDRPQSRRQVPSSKPGLTLNASSLLLVPRYLLRHSFDHLYPMYSWLRFSNNIRLAGPAIVPTRSLSTKSSATAALPDHFYQGNWSRYQEQFPNDTSFLLASDGFYTAFKDVIEMHHWLSELPNAPDALQDEMSSVHGRLQEGAGDDDVSFVWLTPLEGEVPCPAPSKNG